MMNDNTTVLLNETDDQIKRENYYTLADYGYVHRFKEFMNVQKNKVKTVYPNNEYRNYIYGWEKWFSDYILQDKINEMPANWSNSEILPMSIVINEGDAGTGKTFCNNTLFQNISDGLVCSFSKKGTSAFLDYALLETSLNGLDYVIENNTMCKLFKIKYGKPNVRYLLDKIKNNKELLNSHTTLSSYDGSEDKIYHEKMMREHFKITCKVLRPLIIECYEEIVKEYMKYGYIFQNKIINYDNDDDDDDDDDDNNDDNVSLLISLNKTWDINKKKIRECNLFSGIKCQDTYRLAVLLENDTSVRKLPSISSLFSVILFEEDGMAPAFYHDFRKLMLMLINLIYRPPFLYTQPVIIISSGSTSQSSAIGYTISCLELCSSLIYLKDTENTLCYRSEFYRRSKNILKDENSLGCQITCLSLERSMPNSHYTYYCLYGHERHSSLINNPIYIPNGTRLYKKHTDVSNYMNKLENSNDSKPDIEIYDYVYICDMIVEIPNYFSNLNKHYLSAGVKEHCSTLKDYEASCNRTVMWRSKKSLYNDDNYSFDVNKYDDIDNNLGKHIKVNLSSEDIGCSIETEKRIASYRKIFNEKEMQSKLYERLSNKEKNIIIIIIIIIIIVIIIVMTIL